MAQQILRPMEYGDLLDEMFDLYKRKFLLFTGICGVVFLPVYLLTYGLGGAAGAVIAGVLMFPLNYVVTAAITWAVSQSYLGREATILGSYQAIKPGIFAFIGTMIVAGLIMMGGFILFIIPGVIIAFWYAFLSEVFVVEGKTWTEARNRSKQLAEGQWGRIFVLGLLSVVLTWIVTMIITAPGQLLVGTTTHTTPGASGPFVIMGILQAIASSLVTPIYVIVFVLLYYDIRIRKEGFDIEMLAADMEGTSTTTPTPETGARL